MKWTVRTANLKLIPCALLLTVCASTASAALRTNWVERWVTNSIEVYVPANRYVTEYHTNVVLRTRTNVVDVYVTNVVAKAITNHVLVELIRTNSFQAYRTNYKNLSLTNWTTVLVLKTNYVDQTVTNYAELDVPRNQPATSQKSSTTASALGEVTEHGLTVEAIRGPKQTPPQQADVRLNVRGGSREQPLQVKQWKVQSEDGSILCFGQDSDFRRNLPFGTYTVEVKTQVGASTQILSAQGTLLVNAREVRMLTQRRLAKR